MRRLKPPYAACPSCGGKGEYFMEGDAHKSGGIVPCGNTLCSKGKIIMERVPSEENTMAFQSLSNRCNKDLQKEGKVAPRTCARCGLGPCTMYPTPDVQEINAAVPPPVNPQELLAKWMGKREPGQTPNFHYQLAALLNREGVDATVGVRDYLLADLILDLLASLAMMNQAERKLK